MNMVRELLFDHQKPVASVKMVKTEHIANMVLGLNCDAQNTDFIKLFLVFSVYNL